MNSLWRIRYHELKSNNIDIDKETLSFHINTCLREHEEIYGTAINRIEITSRQFCVIFTKR